MKRKIALFVATVMMVTLLPAMNVFASATPSVTSFGGNVKADYDWGKTGNLTDSPVIKIKSDDNSALLPGRKFTIKLTNAKWSLKSIDASFGGSTNVTFTSQEALVVDGSELDQARIFSGSAFETPFKYTMTFVTPTMAEIKIDETSVSSTDDKSLYLPLPVKVNGSGAVTAAITDTFKSGVTPQTITFANGASGSVVVSIDETKQTSKKLTLGEIKIEETIAQQIKVGAAAGTNTIKLDSPANFEWEIDETISPKVGVYGGFSIAGGGEDIALGDANYEDSDHETIKIDTANLRNSSSAGILSISNLKLLRGDNASYGDLKVRVTVPGGGTTTLLVGQYSKQKVELLAEEKDLPEIPSGTYMEQADEDVVKTLKVTIKETTPRAWTMAGEGDKDTTFVLNDEVKFRGMKVTKVDNITNISEDDFIYLDSKKGETDPLLAKLEGTNYATIIKDDKLTLNGLERTEYNDSCELQFELFVSVKPGYTGDITLKAADDNDAIGTDLSVVVGKAVNPITVTAKANKFAIGKMTLPLSNITIKENIAGLLKEHDDAEGYMSGADFDTLKAQNTDLRLWVGSRSDIDISGEPKAVVTDGDLVIDKVTTDDIVSGHTVNQGLIVKVKRESSVPSTIEISGLTLDTDRSLPDGSLPLKGQGFITANYRDDDDANEEYGGFDVDAVVLMKDYVTVGGSAATGTAGNTGAAGSSFTNVVKVTIGESDVMVNGEKKSTDAAPFLSNGNTMVPVRAVIEALGLTDKQITFEPNTKTVTITGLRETVEFAAGSEYIIFNGAKPGVKIPNNATVVIRDGRTYLPFRALGEIVLNVPVGWDQASQTATYNAVTDQIVADTEVAADTDKEEVKEDTTKKEVAKEDTTAKDTTEE